MKKSKFVDDPIYQVFKEAVYLLSKAIQNLHELTTHTGSFIRGQNITNHQLIEAVQKLEKRVVALEAKEEGGDNTTPD